mmetsp:Transcript_3030/g.4367  ORF Transcript_3030/g.4367 Transcript_3030/m.4367 type:complete len:278 (+) Transcript_3030:71-904(+)
MMRSTLVLRRVASAIAPKQSLLRATSLAAPLSAHHSALTSATITNPRSFATAANNLGSILQREINEEDEAAAEFDGQMPPDLAELHSDISAKWTILEGISGIGSGGETGSGATVRLFRKSPGSNGAKIGVVFHCQDTEEDIPFDEEEFLSGQEDDSEEEPSQAVRFGVTVSKAGKTVVLQCRCGGDGAISVESANVRDGESEGVLTALAGGENLNAALYQGPEFTELAEDLQESFQEYVVKECGIDEDVAAFISMYADYREQVEYVTWMKTAIDILD